MSEDRGDASAPAAAASVPPPRDAAPLTQDALQLLCADHRRIEALLDDCMRLAGSRSSPADRSGLLMRLGALLMNHAQLEHELFYPGLAARLAVADARTDHARIEARFKRLNGGGAAEFGERIAELSRLVREHMAEEEGQLFARASSLDLQALGTRMALRRAELLGDQGET